MISNEVNQRSSRADMSLQQNASRNVEELIRKTGLRFETAASATCLPQVRPCRNSQLQKPVIRIFVVYERDLNRNRAQLMQEQLAQRLGHCFDFSVSWWSLKSFWHPKMRRVAANAIARADIVLFALRAGVKLPRMLTKWIEERLFRKTTHRVALLALLETGGMIRPRLSSAEIYLSHLASEVGVDCLCYSDGIPLARTNWPQQGSALC